MTDAKGHIGEEGFLHSFSHRNEMNDDSFVLWRLLYFHPKPIFPGRRINMQQKGLEEGDFVARRILWQMAEAPLIISMVSKKVAT